MEVQEMLEIQKKCQKRAKKIVKRIYRVYDRIWVQRIRVSPELEESGLVGAINAKMPNLLLRREDETPDIEETAKKYGFSDGASLAAFLANYEPRKKREEAIYNRLAEKAFAGLPFDEYEAATKNSVAALSAIVAQCKRMAKEMTQEAYKKYDEVWYGKMRICPQLLRHGKEVVADINKKMSNFLVHDQVFCSVDEIADMYGFESENELIEWLQAYTPRGLMESRLFEKLLDRELEAAANMPAENMSGEKDGPLYDEVPF